MSTTPTISGYYRHPATTRGAYARLASAVAAVASMAVLLSGLMLGIIRGGHLTDATKAVFIAGFAVLILLAVVLTVLGDRSIKQSGAAFRAALAEDVQDRYGLTLRGTVYARPERQLVDAVAASGHPVPVVVEFIDEDTPAQVRLLAAG